MIFTKKIYCINVFIFLIFSLILLTNPAVAAEDSVTDTANEPNVELQVPILGYTKATNIADYIFNIYKSALYIIVPIIVVMLMFGGILRASSGGNQKLIQQSWAYISQALIGLGIVLASYLLLSMIGIDELRNPGIQSIAPGPDENMELVTLEQATQAGAGSSYGSIGGQCFPVAPDSLARVSWNWKGARDGGKRNHAGIDIYTKSPGTIIATADGTVTAVYRFYTCKSGWSGPGTVWAVLINHGDYTINYGEIDEGKVAVKKGDKVVAGQFLGIAGHCGMLHMEVYKGSVSANTAWYAGKPQPTNLVDPTSTIKSLESKQCQKK